MYGYMAFIYLSVDGHLGCFYFWLFWIILLGTFKFFFGVWPYVFISPGYTCRSGISWSYGNSRFNFLRNSPVFFQSGCIILHFHQQYMKVLICPHPFQYLLLSIVLIKAILVGMVATVRSGHGTTDWFQIGKGGCILSPCLFNLYAEYIMRNAGLDEAQVGIKNARRRINNLRYADDTTLMAESEEEPKSLLMKVKDESEKVSLKLNIQKTYIMASRQSHHFMANRWRNSGNSGRIYFGGLQNHCGW